MDQNISPISEKCENKNNNDEEQIDDSSTSNELIPLNNCKSISDDFFDCVGEKNNEEDSKNEALIINSSEFSRMQENYGYNNIVFNLELYNNAKVYLKTCMENIENECQKNHEKHKPFYSIANEVSSKFYNDNEHINSSSYYISHIRYINSIDKRISFDLIWTNEIAKIYFLMFLIYKDPELCSLFVIIKINIYII